VVPPKSAAPIQQPVRQPSIKQTNVVVQSPPQQQQQQQQQQIPTRVPSNQSIPKPESIKEAPPSRPSSQLSKVAPVIEPPKASPPPNINTNDKPPIDWKEALNQVGGDHDFLKEVLQDLLEEAKTAEDDIGGAIQNRDFGGVMRAAHRIKGSASYLSCDPLRDISYSLQQSGHDGEENPTNMALWPPIEEQFRQFKEHVAALKLSIASGVPSDL
jgi:HPt (histidine-containing phosphotransfer) domain-containing protein